MTNISVRAPEQNSFFNAVTSILMGAVVIGAGALSFVVFLTA